MTVTAPTLRDKPTLVGEVTILRPVREADVDVLAELMRDPEVERLTGSVNASDETASYPPIERLREIYAGWARADDRLVLVIVDRTSGDVVGEAVLNDLDERNHSCGFRIFIGAAGRGRGLGVEATRLITRHALRTVGLHRVELEVFDFNPRARHVYERAGFHHEGTGRDALRFDDGWVDVHRLSLLASDLDDEPGDVPD